MWADGGAGGCGRRTLTITRSPAQGLACKELGRNGQKAAITPKATYTPAPNRAGSRSRYNAFASAGACV
ncbi:Alpha-galactosidase [Lacticaseibacillus rhamnosus LRHMDP2]|uniref:Alpha-galactosidase n=1 Tax=Lacticaseibacillus rhamnosus LRHMDP3 TaxID=1203259 RepID=A0AB33XSV4_LACRH|nr:Alpha-galactosidase [Lacticaseibacillus rhamnosus LRHMDP3]EKS50383.1 Alpha-galactosidase [Lacticaseibacillus rhamnosus LRHMDP2]